MIAYFASDLVWATRIRATAESLGIASRPVRSVEMLAARLEDSDVRALIVDLDDLPTALALIRRARESGGAPNSSQPAAKSEPGSTGGRIPIAAFGPHVNTEAFAAARESGADMLLTRGQFHGSLADLLRTLESGQRHSGGAA